ncbi:multi-sensor signal transduction multi-kinase [Rivularia sp. IAM M-261]|nr:multi-sensor signal transduction multi-kinase [Rivularia sp. IAM M-261]
MLSPIKLPGYQSEQLLYEGDDTVIYRAVSSPDNQSVIVKVLKAQYPSVDAIARLKHEYNIATNLKLEGVVKLLRLETLENRLALVFEDFDGCSLKQILNTKKLELKEVLSIAIQLTKALESIHSHNIIHKDIKPGNIIINTQTGIAKLTDFSIASQLSAYTPQIANPSNLEGSLAYISPEQTGRMNRALDYRSDFYSLGVTLYEMLTGKLPFESNDALELIYCHIAKQPIEVNKLNVEIPKEIAAIVMKLMAKNAENRYQTGKGILVDLEICKQQLETGIYEDFIPGRLDYLSQLLIPQKLYGRDLQVDLLLQAFDRVSKGKCELILVSGYSGIGKSSVVNEVNKPITRAKGFFISGKFDQFQRNIPYASLKQALGELMQQLLTETVSKLTQWRQNILEVVEANGQCITDVIPEVELIIGRQPDVPVLTPTESQSRFINVFCKFISVFARKEHPLVIFLDDLQWVDATTLKLLQALITNVKTKYLLIIGAYRDNEVSSTHPLVQTVINIEKSNGAVNSINLQPLSLSNVTQLLTDTFSSFSNTQQLELLGELLFNKTGGNPFFLTQVLITLYQKKQLQFNFFKLTWQWSLQEIQAIGITDKNIIEIVADRIKSLPKTTQEILTTAACIGNKFTLEVLSIVNGKSTALTAQELYPALQSGLILPLDEAYKIPLVIDEKELLQNEIKSKIDTVSYKFLHDRVQQASYSLIPDDNKQETHLKIGQLLLSVTTPESTTDNLLDIVNQLNYGRDLLIKAKEKQELAKFNLMAGQKAKLATAYEASAKYLNVGLELITVDNWHTDYTFTLNLHIEAAEAEYLTGNFDSSARLINLTLDKANSTLDKVKLYEIKIQTLMAQNRMSKVVSIGTAFLGELGVNLPTNPNNFHVLKALLETKLALFGKKIEDLALLPEMTDPYKLASMQILLFVGTAAAQAGSLIFLPTVLTMVQLSIKYGNSPFSAYGYGVYGLILCDKFNSITTGYKFGVLSLNIISNINSDLLKAKIYFLFNSNIQFYKESLANSITNLSEGVQSGLYVGDIEFLGYCATTLCNHSFFAGEDLETLTTKISSYIDLMKSLKLESLVIATGVFQQTALNLQSSSNPLMLIGDAFDEIKMKSEVEKNYSYKGYFYFCKAFLAYLFNDYQTAISSAVITEKTHANNVGFIFYNVNNLFYSLSLLAQFNTVTRSKQIKYLNQVQVNQKQMKMWALHAPCNFKHKYEIVEAEKARVLGKVNVAMDLYDSAIGGARANGYTQEYAIFNELAAKFYLELGKENIAKIYMTEAYYSYVRWGAMTKVNDIEERYSNLIIFNYANQSNNLHQLDITATHSSVLVTTYSKTKSNTKNKILDLTSVIKASHAISSEILLDKLLTKLLLIVIENAAAQKGCLILFKGTKLFIEAIKNESSDVILNSIAVDQSKEIPLSVINYVTATESDVVLTSAISDTTYQSDSYISKYKVKSILCVPIFNQGKLIGILYLENNFAVGAFTSERVELLKFIMSQAVISLENSRLYQQAQDTARQLETSLNKLTQTQLQLVQSEKMSTLGSLVAGIGHEINNPIGFISGNLQPAKDYVQDLLELIDLFQYHYQEPVADIVDKIRNIDLDYLREDLPNLIASMQEGVNRIYDVSMSLRTFSRADAQKPITCNIHEIINSTLLILKHRLKASESRPAIEVIQNYSELSEVSCFSGQISQVLMNLVANAIDALEDSNIGRSFEEIKTNPNRIIITTAKSVDDKYVSIKIQDNAKGMTQEVKEKIFDYLFTTKGVGKGTGLGLAIARQIIVEKHNGKIDVNSKLGQGSEFIIQLPL